MSVETWIDTCSAAGFDVSRLSLEAVYDLHARIINDTELKQAALKKLRGSVLLIGARTAVLREWSNAKREALRRRV